MHAPTLESPAHSPRWLTLPTPERRARATERATWLLSVVLLSMAALGVILATVQWAGGATVVGAYAAVGGAVGAILIAFLLSRAQHLHIAGLIATSVPTITGLAIVVADPTDPGWFAFMGLNPVLGRLFLNMSWSIPLAAANLVAVVLAVVVVDVPHATAIVALVFNTVVFSVTSAGAWYRTSIDRDARRAEAERSQLAELILEATFSEIALVRGCEVVDANEAFTSQFRAEAHVTSGRPITDFFDPEAVAVLEAVGDRTTGPPVEVTATRLDGSTFDAEVLIRQTTVDRDHATVLAIRDVTERKRSAEALARADRTDSIARLAAVVAHDTNNELLVISGLTASLARQQAVAGLPTESARQIEAAADRVAALIRRVLLYGRLDSSEPQHVNVVDFVNDHAESWRHILGRGIELHVAHDDTDGGVEIEPDKLAQALLNVILNASDSIERTGNVFVRTSAVWVGGSLGPDIDLPAGRYYSIRVRDTGTGIPHEHLPFVFEAFYTTKGGDLGSGLGLYASRESVRAAGGDISIETSPRGTAVTIYLPDNDFRDV